LIYLWEVVPHEYPEKFIGEYDRKVSPDRFLLKQARILDKSEFNAPVIRFNMTVKQARAWDVLSSNAMVPLVGSRLADYLMQLAPEDIQLIPAIIRTKDEEVTDYCFVNVLNKVTGIDKSISKMEYMVNSPSYIRGFRYLKYQEGCMGPHLFARDAEYSSHLLVDEGAVISLNKENFKGLGLYDPETISW
jgi:hypothetical protein